MPTFVDHAPRTLVLGSTGFIGSRVAALLAGSGRTQVIALSRKPDDRLQKYNAITAAADISVQGSLLPFLAEADVVVHAASYVGSDAGRARETNETGTANVVEQCRDSGARLIYVSTCSVYGTGPHRGLREGGVEYRPASAASASRRRAEEMVLDYGGEVVRPNLVFGEGDRWLIPGILKMLDAAGGWPGDGSALLSVISVESLGKLIAGLALGARQAGQSFHAAFPDPVPVSLLLNTVVHAFGRDPVEFLGDDPAAARALEHAGFSRHQIDLVTSDHWYSSKRIWRLAGIKPESPSEALSGLAASYSASNRGAKGM
ncbi:NAD-dependent epimerase/dehydratase family protein [bacterium RCC_150]